MELALSQFFRKAVKAHEAGQLQEAERAYTAVLDLNPHHPDANHNLGVLAVIAGKLHDSLPFFRTALQASPETAQFWLSYIEALLKLGKVDDAKIVLETAIKKGGKGSRFDELKEKLNLSKLSAIQTERSATVSDDKLKSIILLLNQGKLSDALNACCAELEKCPGSIPLLSIQGAIYRRLNKFDLALDAYQKALLINPESPEVLNNLGNALKEQGNLQKATEVYKKALVLKPNSADICYNLGTILEDQGFSEIALELFERALINKPDFAEAYNSIGNALRVKGDLVASISNFEKALQIRPQFAEASNNLGVAFQKCGRLTEAVKMYNQAIDIRPDLVEAFYNLGNLYHEEKKFEQAIACYVACLKRNPNFNTAYEALAFALAKTTILKPIDGLEEVILNLLDKKKYVRPYRIGHTLVQLLKMHKDVSYLLYSCSENFIQCNLEKTILKLSNIPLLIKTMKILPIPDLEIEALFRLLRAKILFSNSTFSDNEENTKFISALALQAFTNEYIYKVTREEEEKLQKLEEKVHEKLLTNVQPRTLELLCIASYKSLSECSWFDLIDINTELYEVGKRQIQDFKQEIVLKSEIKVLSSIRNSVSKKVRRQYEEYPYPRWVQTHLFSSPSTILKVSEDAQLKIVNKNILTCNNPDILVAGCGTGQHAIETASRFKNSSITAIDISLNSLGYAKRSALELGLTNIDFIHADLLDATKLGKKFDIVECLGVLHHTQNPIEGWNVLSRCLKLEGLMKISLYSEIAREPIVALRRQISELKLGNNAQDMKAFRDTIIQFSDNELKKRIVESPDFYTVSTLRDLLFNVKEHRFTMLEILKHLNELNLIFCGYEADTILEKFRIVYREQDDIYDLEKWHLFEIQNPTTFSGTNGFWCQKII